MDTCICVTECLRCSPDTNTALSVNLLCHCCSVSKSHPVLQPHGLKLTRRLCPPLSPEVCSNSCLLSKSAILQYKIKRFFKKESIVEMNLIWITFLYTWNEQNSVNQLYFNVFFLEMRNLKHIFTVWHPPQFWTWVLCISESSMPLLTCSLAWCPPSPPALHFSLHSRIHLPLKTIKSFQQRLELLSFLSSLLLNPSNILFLFFPSGTSYFTSLSFF